MSGNQHNDYHLMRRARGGRGGECTALDGALTASSASSKIRSLTAVREYNDLCAAKGHAN